MQEWRVEDLPINVESVLRGQGADPEIIKMRNPRLFFVSENALNEGVRLLKPEVIYRQLRVKEVRHEQLLLEGGFKLSGDIVSQHLVTVQSIIAIICTIGTELESYASRVSETNLVYGLALDGVGSAGVETLSNAVCSYFEQESLKNGFHTTIPLSPGMIGWPVEKGQPILFEILKPEKIGVDLNPQYMMSPRKTVSILIGVGKELDNSRTPCDFCAMNVTCRYKNQYGHQNKK